MIPRQNNINFELLHKYFDSFAVNLVFHFTYTFGTVVYKLIPQTVCLGRLRLRFTAHFNANTNSNRTWHYWIACFLRASCSVVPYLNRSNSIIKIFYHKRSSFDSFQVIFSQIVSIRVVQLKLWLVLAVSKNYANQRSRQIGTRSFAYSLFRSHWDIEEER